jgi:hypothetical protein
MQPYDVTYHHIGTYVVFQDNVLGFEALLTFDSMTTHGSNTDSVHGPNPELHSLNLNTHYSNEAPSLPYADRPHHNHTLNLEPDPSNGEFEG